MKTYNVQVTGNQFNIANLPYIKYGPEILQDENYQFKIIKDELNILFDKTIEFRTMLTYKYSVRNKERYIILYSSSLPSYFRLWVLTRRRDSTYNFKSS